MVILSDLGAVLGRLGLVLERSWLGALGVLLAALRALLGTSWGDPGGSGLGTYSFLKV